MGSQLTVQSVVDAAVASCRRWRLSRSTVVALLVTPFVITLLYTVFLTLPPTRDTATAMLDENRPVELLTTVFLFAACYVAVRLVRAARRAAAPWWIVGFYGLFAVASFVVAMEEIAWGQWLLGFETPDAVAERNQQGELTIHNLEGVHGRTEFLRLFFGLGGLLGVWLGRRPAFEQIAPPPVLTGWFVVITGLAIPDLTNDLFGLDGSVWALFDYLSELNEFLVALVTLIFLWLLTDHWAPDTGDAAGGSGSDPGLVTDRP